METLVATPESAPNAVPSEGVQVPQPRVEIKFGHKDVTADLSPYLINVSYTDYLEGESDSLDISLEDRQGLFMGDWFPEKGDDLSLAIGYAGAELLDCGKFEIDEVTVDMPPSVVTIRALAAGVKRSVRTHQGRAYEDTTLKAIAAQVAKRNKLRLVGNIEPIPIRRVTQIYERDLAFLKRLAAEYGYAFSVRGDDLVFYRLDELRNTKPVLVIDYKQVTRGRFTDKIKDVYATASVSYHDPKKRRTVRGKAKSKRPAGGDELKLNRRAENPAQAERKAQAALERANRDQTSGSISVPGETRLVAGNNISLTGFGRFNGDYQITTSRHSFSRSGGYATEVELKRIVAE